VHGLFAVLPHVPRALSSCSLVDVTRLKKKWSVLLGQHHVVVWRINRPRVHAPCTAYVAVVQSKDLEYGHNHDLTAKVPISRIVNAGLRRRT
jgi:hypothetical protein